MDLDQKLKESVLNILQANPNGVFQKTLQDNIPNLTAEQLLCIVTDLCQSRQIETVVPKGSKEPLFKLKDCNILTLEKRLKADEEIVNKKVREAGPKGISPALIKRHTKFKESQVATIEKRLLEIGLIKLYYFNGQKIYVAIDTVADISLTEKLYVMEDKNSCETRIIDLQNAVLDVLTAKYKQAVNRFEKVSEQHRVSVVSLGNILQNLGSSYDKKISEKEIKLILDSLVYSQEIIQVEYSFNIKQQSSDDNSKFAFSNLLYRLKPKQTQTLESINVFPCILCPHKEYCTSGKEISPENCKYLDVYLNLF